MTQAHTARFGTAWLIALFILAGCGEHGDDTTGPTDDEDRGRIEGRVANTTPPDAALAFSRAATPDFASTAGTATATAAAAVAGEIDAQGELVEQSAAVDVDASGRFTVTDVPTGNTRMVVEVRDASDARVGRALVHGAVEAGTTTRVTPVSGETTAEANVFAELRRRGTPARDIATTELAARIDFESESEASATAVSGSAVAELATGFEAAEEAFVTTAAQAGAQADAATRFEAGADAAAVFVEALFAGGDDADAHRAYLDALVEAYVDAGLSTDVQARAGSAAAVAADAAVSERTAALAVLRGTVRQMAAARSELAVDGLARLGAGEGPVEAVHEARADFDASVDAAASIGAVLDACERFESVVVAELEEVARSEAGMDAATWLALETAVASGSFRTQIEVRLGGGVAVGTIVDAFTEFYTALRGQVVATATAAGHSAAEAEAFADVFVAAESGLEAAF